MLFNHIPCSRSTGGIKVHVTHRSEFIISEKMGPIIPLSLFFCGVLKDDVYINILHNEGDMK